MALLVGADGDKLSKRLGSLSVESLRDEEGFEPMAITSLLAKIGTSDPVEVRESVEALAAEFDFSKLSRTPARFDPAELARLNAKLVHAMDYADVKERLSDLGADGGEAFWTAVRPNLERVRDVIEWKTLVEGPVTPVIEDAEYAATAAQLLPEGDYTLETWGAWTAAIKAQTGRKGRDLFKPLRLALTGQERGPEMDRLLMLIGRERAMKRLAGETA
jgi:glutamyl-tRNA synthetase